MNKKYFLSHPWIQTSDSPKPIKVRRKIYENNHTKHFNIYDFFFVRFLSLGILFYSLWIRMIPMFVHFNSGIKNLCVQTSFKKG